MNATANANATEAFDPHLNLTVPLIHLYVNASNASYQVFNPYKFENAGLLTQNVMFNEPALYAACVVCYFPLSGSYCTLNRILFFAEALFALVALLLDYIWLSSVAVAAVLNYTTVAAIHMIVLLCVPGNTILDLDYHAATMIVDTGLFFAYPLLQWSQVIRKKDLINTRYIIGCWAILICICAAVGEYIIFPAIPFPPLAEVTMDAGPIQDPAIYLGTWYLDTLNPLGIDTSLPVYENRNLSIGSCRTVVPLPESSLRKGQSFVAAPVYSSFLYSGNYRGSVTAFIVYAIITVAATCCAVLHGKFSTRYARAKIYLYIVGTGKQSWRHTAALVIAFIYHAIHFIVGILSLPVAIILFIFMELGLSGYPTSDESAYIGQWGPWVGAIVILLAAVMNESNIVMQLRDCILWGLGTLLIKAFPKKFTSPPKKPKFDMKFNLRENAIDAAKFMGRFFAEEYSSTFEWVRKPEETSKRCIDAEDAVYAEVKTPPPSPPTQAVPLATVPPRTYDPAPTFGLTGRQTWGMP